jgi:redox-sensing transcriptional repressor
MTEHNIPDIIIGRLPLYLQLLQRLQQLGHTTTSSQELGEKLGISAAQIRKDLSQFGGFGKQGTGYPVGYLVSQIKSILKVDRVWDIVLVGAGDLGHAIARYQGFSNRGFRIVLVMDNDPSKIGQTIGNFTIQDSAKLAEQVKPLNIKIAMLTLPAQFAQEMADSLVQAGVRAILNYAPITLSVPQGVQVEYIDPLLQLQHMSYYL